MWGKIVIVSLLVYIPVIQCSCQGGRSVLTNATGLVTDGESDYPAYARCEWLIDAKDPNKAIYLEFESLDTECSYDFLFIYEGDSFMSPVLASLSGSNKPEPVIATSGKMLVYLFSDRNYERHGFRARYEIQNCPHNCSGHGNCIDHKCLCFPGRIGDSCEREQCPNNCGHGKCVVNKDDGTTSVCECDEGYTGYMCNISLNDIESSQHWYTVLTEGMGFEPRSAHAGAFMSRTNCLYIFGGFSLNEILGDLKRFCFQRNKWETLNISEPWPSGRYEHAVAQFDDGFYMFGGIMENGSYSQQLWFFNATSESWKICAENSTVRPLELSGHTLTTVENHLYLFGGKTIDGRFRANMYKIDGNIPEQWHQVKPLAGKSSLRRLVGHSTVYHKESKSLLIYGGYSHSPDQPRYGSHTDNLHVFHVEYLIWSGISFKGDTSNAPSQRSFHSALIMGNYMVIYGGNTHIHHDEERCYDYEMFLYHLGCHKWVDPSVLMSQYSKLTMENKGRVSHVAVSAYGNILLVAGGYAGYVRGDLIAFKFPPLVAPPESEAHLDLDYCFNNTRRDKCQANPDCFYCNDVAGTRQELCMHRTLEDNCRDSTAYIGRTACPGICRQLTTCLSCLSQGQGATLTDVSPEKRTYIQPCNWCVKEGQCQQRSKPEGNCLKSESTVTGLVGWWNGPSASLSQIDQCRTEDLPAGLIAVKYRSAVNDTLSQPDEVDIIRLTQESETFRHIFVRENLYSRIRWMGFIHPLDATIKGLIEPPFQYTLKLVAGKITVIMQLAKYPNASKLETVQKIPFRKDSQSGQISREFNQREDDSPLFINISRGNRYYLELNGQYEYPKYSDQYKKGTKMYNVELQWDGRAENGNNVKNFHPFTFENLEPYNNGSCKQYTNCLACMTDTLCGWCNTENLCVLRNSSGSLCTEESRTMLLITESSTCPICEDHVECNSCAQDHLCEWVKGQVCSCVRRGRAEESKVVRDPTQCLQSCHQRRDCSSCLNMTECAWCENLGTCLPFSDYVSRHRYGQCTEWIDNYITSNSSPYTCRNCSSKRSCDSCLNTFNCGWCGNRENPNIGVCFDGDFSGPYHNATCSELVAASTSKASISDLADWSYGGCPDVEECVLGLSKCHANAACINTPTNYTCTCNKGFHGDGINCIQTCYHKCANGICMDDEGEYFCDCNLGWTGDDCATDCKCNGHSMCENGTGKCDLCLNGTNGPYCDLCLIGYYGDPKTRDGCFECKCNGHGDESRGKCNNKTGECYCMDNTMGYTCDHCRAGYYGDSRDGGKCYLSCDHGLIVENSSKGALGSYSGPGVSTWRAYCLWVISVLPSIDLVHNQIDNRPTVTFGIEDLAVECERDHVYVYDGIPKFVDSKGEGMLLGAYCGSYTGQFANVTAMSGVVTVYFDADISLNYSTTQGFNGSYYKNHCDEKCGRNQQCVDSHCTCLDGYTGLPDCIEIICDLECKYQQSSSSCVCEIQKGITTYEIAKFHIDTNTDEVAKFQVEFASHGGKGPTGRYGHVLIYCGDDSMYLFGGRSLKYGLLNDMWQFNLTSNHWTEIIPRSNIKPTPRYFHTGSCVPSMKVLYVFGGLVKHSKKDFDSELDYVASSEMWKFGLENHRWAGLPELVWMTPLAGHSMTLVEDNLVIIGGFSTVDYFNENVYIHKTNSFTEKWKELNSENKTDAKPTGLYGHTAVYHSASKTIYIYGGHVYRHERLQVSGYLFTYDITDHSWNILQPELNIKPELRYFHAAVGLDDYMAVIGGFTQHHNTSFNIMIYSYRCNFWHQLDVESVTGTSLTSLVASSAIKYNNHVYLYGGLDGVAHNDLYRIRLPDDICQIHNELTPLLGCSAAIFQSNITGVNSTVCFSAEQRKPPERKGEGLYKSVFYGKTCNSTWYRQRDCENIKNCSECIATYPLFKNSRPSCLWCGTCLLGQCVKQGYTCGGVNKCSVVQISDQTSPTSGLQTQCLIPSCRASTCEKCKRLKCHWSQHFQRIFSRTAGAPYREVNLKPRFEWSCMSTTFAKIERNAADIVYGDGCPPRCHTHVTCGDCLEASGSEGGSKECYWSVTLNECMPPAYVSLHCLGGECGTILQGPMTKCPRPCSIYTKCADCRRAQGCGWCAYEGQNGKGECMPGTRHGPSQPEMCMKQTSPPGKKITNVDRNKRVPSWAYATCPPENECDNDHHNCDLDTEKCNDELTGFTCTCKDGYRRADDEGRNVCKPVCHQECVKGNCIKPDKCDCFFGYVGNNCSTKCDCNGHSSCQSVDRRDTCIKCMNNTKGRQCNQCKPLYVGDPRNGGHCTSCTDFCNQHSDICLYYVHETLYKDAIQTVLDKYPDTRSAGFLNAFSQIQKTGPTLRNDTTCLDCRDNTMGNSCKKCKPDYFRLPHMKAYEPCIKCMCNGHSDICDADSGLNCRCQDNTETRCSSDGKSEVKCHEAQCADCKEGFQGKPTEGHHCYRLMTVNKDYCLDPLTQAECTRNPAPLMHGRTVFFVVQPKYVNVDIRITLDVTIGDMDVFFSSQEDTFIVDVDGGTGNHHVRLDPGYLSYITAIRRKRDLNVISAEHSEFREVDARSINTFITVNNPETILVIRKLQGRLVITLPNNKLNLKTSRFYMVLYSTGDKVNNKTLGNLYFRQDQPHIDLFVFFSVFFSCFFLFLAMCVLLWKTKQGIDARRSRQQRAREMLHMASRPFAKVLVNIDHPITPINISPNLRVRSRKVTDTTPLLSPENTNLPFSLLNVRHSCEVVPIALEPMEDGVAAIGTLVFQLPGGMTAPSQLCLGSTLMNQMPCTGKNRRQPISSSC